MGKGISMLFSLNLLRIESLKSLLIASALNKYLELKNRLKSNEESPKLDNRATAGFS